ncbi:hypothetical protein QJS10_CPB18g02074 [Acorus calamus]|uniref:Uncharacterized protein n=1 Tax=Acorus calamus TaxID=4465 RepID=A0AAV9CKW9_ACOCL|nr:hypothetical protein QJS10_CPB18g02074 [Acorus calamus]
MGIPHVLDRTVEVLRTTRSMAELNGAVPRVTLPSKSVSCALCSGDSEIPNIDFTLFYITHLHAYMNFIPFFNGDLDELSRYYLFREDDILGTLHD